MFLSDLSKSYTRDVTCQKSKTLILETNLEIEFNREYPSHIMRGISLDGLIDTESKTFLR